jgi:hypothetical protein
MRSYVVAALFAAVLPAAASAQPFEAVNHLNVLPLGGTTFEVIEARGEGPRGIWCAAAEFAEQRLGANGRIYIREARGPSRSVSGRTAVAFTTNTANLTRAPSQSLSVTTSQVGVGLPIAHAIQFCRDNLGRDDHVRERY